MKKLTVCQVVVIACSLFFSGCEIRDDSEDSRAEDLITLLLQSNKLNTISFVISGQAVSMSAKYGFFETPDEYAAEFLGSNSRSVGITLPLTITEGTICFQTTDDFLFTYCSGTDVFGTDTFLFTFNITSLSSGRIEAEFYGWLESVTHDPVAITDGQLSATIQD